MVKLPVLFTTSCVQKTHGIGFISTLYSKRKSVERLLRRVIIQHQISMFCCLFSIYTRIYTEPKKASNQITADSQERCASAWIHGPRANWMSALYIFQARIRLKLMMSIRHILLSTVRSAGSILRKDTAVIMNWPNARNAARWMRTSPQPKTYWVD